MPDSDKPAPNQTIQLDALDPAEAEKIVGAGGPSVPPGDGAPSRRKTPPPLPPTAFVSNPPSQDGSHERADGRPSAAPAAFTSRAPSIVPAPPLSPAKKAAIGVALAVVIGGAIAGGLAVGGNARSHMAPAASGGGASAGPAPSASDSVLVLPTIEMSSQPSGNGSAP
jgi:hypothetical protein